MPFDFGQKKPAKSKKRLARPTNYLSRRVQWRVFFLVAMFMLVIVLMKEARDPKNWQWMWELQKSGPVAVKDDAEEPVDTRLRVPSEPSGETAEAIVIGGRQALSVAEDETESVEEEMTSPLGDDPLQQCGHDAWSRLIEQFSSEDRVRFLKGLKAARDATALPQDERQDWSRIIGQLEEGWRDYLDQAFLTVAQDDARLTNEERKLWLDIIEQLKANWNDQLKPAFLAMSDDRPLDEGQRQALERVQRTLDGVFLDSVRDNTVFRPSEKDAWFRLLEDLNRRHEEDLHRSSVGRVGFLQLYRQPREYRGELVTVGGEVRLGYHRQAPQNIYGITSYYIFWLKPSATDSPIVVYCLDVPDGFPDVRAIEDKGKKPVLREDAEFTGYFFKRWAYRAEDGTRLAPLVLAKTPRWQPRQEAIVSPEEMPSATFWIAIVGGTCVFGIAFAVLIYRFSQRSGPRREAFREDRSPKSLHLHK